MKISCDYKTFTFFDITFEEFRAIRKFMNEAKDLNDMKQEQHPKAMSEIVNDGMRLAEQIDNVTLSGY